MKHEDLERLHQLQQKYAGKIDIEIQTRQDMNATCVFYTNWGTRNDDVRYRLKTRRFKWGEINTLELIEMETDLFKIAGF